MCNDNRAALMQDDHAFGGAPQLNSRVVNDVRGYVAELAAKAVDKDLMAQPVTWRTRTGCARSCADSARWIRILAYRGSSRAGWSEPPDATQAGTAVSAVGSPRSSWQSDFWQGPMQFGEFPTMAATMLQPVGGMGRIGEAFGRALAASSSTRRW